MQQYRYIYSLNESLKKTVLYLLLFVLDLHLVYNWKSEQYLFPSILLSSKYIMQFICLFK
jgi:hypothetical protein